MRGINGVQNCPTHRLNVENLENPRGYATSDLWEPHPTKKGLWRVYVKVHFELLPCCMLTLTLFSTGRKDDVLVLGSGVSNQKDCH
jgi:hypothetical protein